MDATSVKAQAITDHYALYNGDSCEILPGIPDNSIHFEIYSPPFASLYTYSNSERDLGNCKSDGEFFEHFSFIIKELYRVLMPGRIMAVHCMNLPTSKERDGYIGIKDFRGELIRAFQKEGFIYHSEVCIWKDPVIAMQRTKALGLLHKQLKKDSCMSRQGIPDYLVAMRKPGDNPERVEHTNESFPVSIWQRYASPIWTDINPSDTLQATSCRDEKDERHICLAEGTLVLTKRGYISIEDTTPGEDETLCDDGKWHKIIAKAKTQENAPVIQTKAVGIPHLLTTSNHKIKAKKINGSVRKEKLGNADESWIEAEHLENCYIKSILPPVADSNISAKEWWIIGRWLADGHVDFKERQFFVSVSKNKWDEFYKIAGDNIGATHEFESVIQVGLIRLSDQSRAVLKKCGKGAKNKLLPVECISLNSELSKCLFDGYMSGDGHKTKNGHIMFTSVSRALLLGMAIVAHRAYGYIPSIYGGRGERTGEILGRTVHQNKEWLMTASPNYSFCHVDGDTTWHKVRKANIEHGTADVWSIEVDENHSFTAEGCIVKNCPLQLTVIRRALNLWSNPGDTVLSPFMGIGSEGVVSLQSGRRFVGVELKPTWYEQSVKNCAAVTATEQQSLW